MKYVVISDLHSNLEALEGFQADLKAHNPGPHTKVCLGDIVGYGGNPNEIVDWVRGNCGIVLAGNHDYAVVGKTDVSYFNPYAKKACEWTGEVLTPENRDYLASLPVARAQDGIFWAHSSPFEPEEWHYIISRYDGMENFPHFSERLCFVGHSHNPLILEENPEEKVELYYDTELSLNSGHRYIFNVGSLGQPRDGNPDPAYAIYDDQSNTYQLRRFGYAVEKAQQKIRAAGLPAFLSDRLAVGH